jgi:alginate O-acetyltransferase complex protein AlgJ
MSTAEPPQGANCAPSGGSAVAELSNEAASVGGQSVAQDLTLPAVPPPAPGDHPLRDRVVTMLFVIAIAWPALALIFTWSRTITRFENRPMAPWPSPALSREFPAAFDRAFSDRFGGRDTLVRAHHGSLLLLFGVSSLPNVMRGTDGWFYWLGEDSHSLDRHYRGTMRVAQSEVDNTVAEFARRKEWLAARGIAYVVAVVPEKFTIYPEHLPSWVARSPLPTPYDRLRAAMDKDGRVAFVDLRAPLFAAKARERVYYKTDSHWNYNGAIVGYDEIMRAVQKALPEKLTSVAPVKRPAHAVGDIYRGDLLLMLGMPARVGEDDVAPLGKVLADVASRCARRTDKDEFQGFEFYACNRPGLPRAVVLRDSMAISLIPLLSENFSRVVYVSTRKLDRALIEREKPDIVIEELVERSLHAPGASPMN